jgi:hypothetical protein
VIFHNCAVSFVFFVFVLCTQCYQFFWIVHFWLPLRFSLAFTWDVYVVCTCIIKVWRYQKELSEFVNRRTATARVKKTFKNVFWLILLSH